MLLLLVLLLLPFCSSQGPQCKRWWPRAGWQSPDPKSLNSEFDQPDLAVECGGAVAGIVGLKLLARLLQASLTLCFRARECKRVALIVWRS